MMPMCDWNQMARQALCDELGGVEFYTRMAQCAPTEAESRAVLEIARDELRHALFASNILNLGCEVPANPTNGAPPVATPFGSPVTSPITPITPVTPVTPVCPMPELVPSPSLQPMPMQPIALQPIPLMSPWGSVGTPMPLTAPMPMTEPTSPWGGSCPPWYSPMMPFAAPFGSPVATPFTVPVSAPMPRVPDYPEPPPTS